MLSALFGEQEPDANSKFLAMESSTATLVMIIRQFYMNVIEPRGPADKAETANLARLMFRSQVEDGEFARLFLRAFPSRLVAKLEKCIQAAAGVDDLDVSLAHPNIAGWFAPRLAST